MDLTPGYLPTTDVLYSMTFSLRKIRQWTSGRLKTRLIKNVMTPSFKYVVSIKISVRRFF